MANCEIKYCANCAQNHLEHEFQDATYGKFKRVFNVNEKTGIGCCTVCNNGKKLRSKICS